MKESKEKTGNLINDFESAFEIIGNDFYQFFKYIYEKFILNLIDIWQTFIWLGILFLIEYIIWYSTYGYYFPSYDSLIFLILQAIVISIFVIYNALLRRKLRNATDALADGNLNYEIDLSGMHGDFREIAENLNSISEGMNIAIEQRLKSERMKTELITNVSHDLKTPLTSIINYANLIGQEKCENVKITEYSEVLVRQSVRMKRLIEDLVEASKASTGNLEVQLETCEAEILLTQAAGEFEQKLHDAGLELKVVQPENSVKIMADSRRLWRVFDNLMNNICKYGQRGTRVYLILEETEKQAVITFKNTSHAELNFSADELTERFVRGDVSRNTEGNGLGLSIAKSLTELQNGTFDLQIDGDLFKVILKFPKLQN